MGPELAMPSFEGVPGAESPDGEQGAAAARSEIGMVRRECAAGPGPSARSDTVRAISFVRTGDTLNVMSDDGAAWRDGTGGRG
jgi:hypothetical protein